MREKKRYLYVKIEFGEKLDERSAKKLFSQAVLDVLGESGAAQAGFAFKQFNPTVQSAVVKCSTESLDLVISALALKRFFDDRDVALRLEKIAGSFSPKK